MQRLKEFHFGLAKPLTHIDYTFDTINVINLYMRMKPVTLDWDSVKTKYHFTNEDGTDQ